MGNCIGNGVYGRGIATGHKLIVMLKIPGVRGGKSFCDIEIDRHTWKVRQCYTKGNRIPPDEVRELANSGTRSARCSRRWKGSRHECK